MTDLLDSGVNCGHCKTQFNWRSAYVQRRTPEGDAGRDRPRVFCPTCGFLVLDTPHRDSAWVWNGEVNELGNLKTTLCPPGASGWGRAKIKGVERSLPLLIPDSLAVPVDEAFIDVRAARAAILKPPLVSKPPVLAVVSPRPASPKAGPRTLRDEAGELLRLATAKIRDNDFAGAVGTLDEALRLNPEFAEALCARGYAKGELADLAGATRDYSDAITVNPAIVDAHCGRAFVRALAGDDEGSIGDFSEALRLDARCVPALLNRAILRSRRDPDAAIEDLTLTVELEPGNARAITLRGILHAKAGKYPLALEDFRRAIRLDPRDGQAYCYQGISETGSQKPELAVKSFDRAIELDADSSEAFFGRGVAKAQLGRNADASEDLTTSLGLDPGNDEALCQRGIVNFRLGRFDAAISDHEAALAINPKSAANLYSRGLALSGAGRFAEAVPDFDAAIRLEPAKAESFHARGLALARLGRHSDAAKEFSHVLELEPENAEAFYQRGLAKKAAGDDAGAELDFSRSGGLKDSSQVQRRLISEEKNASIAAQISVHRARAMRLWPAAAAILAVVIAFAFIEVNRGWADLVLFILAMIAAVPAIVRLLVLFSAAYDLSKGNPALAEKLARLDLLDTIVATVAIDPFRLFYILPSAVFGPKRCLHCKTQSRYTSRRCPRCGAPM